jgi:hypothetical protein
MAARNARAWRLASHILPRCLLKLLTAIEMHEMAALEESARLPVHPE